MPICGLDIGTTGCKITVFDDQGKYLDQVYCDYPVTRNISEHEVRAESIWGAVKRVISKAALKFHPIRGIGITSFGETFVLLDKDDEPIYPAMLYTDPRGTEECEGLVQELGEKQIRSITGLKPHKMYSIPKVMWLKKNRKDLYDRAKRILLMGDYIVYMLTGNAQIDYSLASRTMAFDIRQLMWSNEVFDAAGIDEKLMSKPVPTGTSAGIVKESIAGILGLNPDTMIVSVSHDQVAAALGSGVFSEATAVDGAGTVECITPIFGNIPENDVFYDGGYSIVPYITPGKYVCYAFIFTGGALIKWFIDNFAINEKAIAIEKGCSLHDMLELKMKDNPTGILVLPHFAGAATPHMDSDSKGVILGLTITHNISDVYKAIMEGVVYEMLVNIEELSKAGIKFNMLRATGGGANSSVWMQMKADILNMPMVSLGSNEAGATGSAMYTGVAVGIFNDLKAAARAMIHEQKIYYPRREQHEAYMEIYERYKKLYPAVRPLMG